MPLFFLIPNAKCFEYRQTFCMMINRQFLTIVIGFFWQFKLNATTFFLWPDFYHIFTTQLLHIGQFLVEKLLFIFVPKRHFSLQKTWCALFWHIKVFRPKAGGVWCVFLSFSLWKIAFSTTYQENIITTQKLVASQKNFM